MIKIKQGMSPYKVLGSTLLIASVIINVVGLLSFGLKGLVIMWALAEFVTFFQKNSGYWSILKWLMLFFSAAITFMYINLVMTNQLQVFNTYDDELQRIEAISTQLVQDILEASTINKDHKKLSNELLKLKSTSATYYSKTLPLLYDYTNQCTFKGMKGSRKQKKYVTKRYTKKCNAILSLSSRLDAVNHVDVSQAKIDLQANNKAVIDYKRQGESFVQMLANSSQTMSDNIEFILKIISASLSLLFSFAVFAAGSINTSSRLTLTEKQVHRLAVTRVDGDSSINEIKKALKCGYGQAKKLKAIL